MLHLTIFAFILFPLVSTHSSVISTKLGIPPEAGLSLEELITFYNYPLEIHEVVTEDGYILTLYRIPYGLSKSEEEERPAVLFVGGMTLDAGSFAINGRNGSLSFWLADRGYDVWLANYRGTTHSRRHVTFDPDVDKAQFWNYSFHEIGYYDVPAFVDYVLNVTGQEDLFYIGHSQGATTFFVLGSELPEYNSKIRLAVALAPVGFLTHTSHALFRVFAYNKDVVYLLATTFGVYEMFPHTAFLTESVTALCNDDAPTQLLCVAFLEGFNGFNLKELNKTMIPVMFSQITAGASMKQFMHYGQEYISGHFRRYDYGTVGNLLKYGAPIPPDYNIDSITAPVAIFYGKNDIFTNYTDVDRFADLLPSLALKYLVEDEEFTHMDFTWAIHSEELFFQQLLQIMSEY